MFIDAQLPNKIPNLKMMVFVMTIQQGHLSLQIILVGILIQYKLRELTRRD